MKNKLTLPYFTQTICWLILKPALLFFARFKVFNQKNVLGLKPPIIIVCNHQSFYDALFLGNALNLTSSLLPLHFMAKDVIYRHVSFKIYAWLSGAFPSKKHQGLAISLAKPVDILKKNGTVALFPEGSVIKEDRVACEQGRKGAAMLACFGNYAILPVAIKGTIGINFSNFLLRRHKVRIVFGQPFGLSCPFSSFDADYQEQTQKIMAKIKELYDSL